MSRSISLSLPPGVDRAAVQAVGTRSRRDQRERHPEHRIRLRGDQLTVRTTFGGAQRPTPARLRVRVVATPGQLRLDGTFTLSRIWQLIDLGVLVIFLAGLVAGVIDGSWQPIVIFGIGTVLIGWVAYTGLRDREEDEAVFGDDSCRVLLEQLGDPG